MSPIDKLAAALKLPKKARTRLALKLLDSLPVAPDLQADLDDAAWQREISNRAREALSPDFSGATWKSVRAKLKRKHGV